MITVYDQKNECCGCTACYHVCPTHAIFMETDEEGFLYPKINQLECKNCGLCKKACAFQNRTGTTLSAISPDIYAVKHKDEAVRMLSSSGGAFTAISDYIMDNNGIVYGVAFDDNWNVVHQKALTKEEKNRFRGSKYVQSNLRNTFKEIGEYIREGKLILFTGTPCQTAAIKQYLSVEKISKDNLIACDIICHGTPSPLIWKEHVKFLEEKNKSQLVEYYFRSKVNGWHQHTEMAVFKNGKKDYRSSISQAFKALFYSHNILRPSCYNCIYTTLSRTSDITIADFWGIEKSMPDFDDNKGVSLMMINTDKGKELFDGIKSSIIYKKMDVQDCTQPHLQHPAKPSEKRNDFWKDYHAKGYEYVIKKYAGCSVQARIKRFLASILKKIGLYNVVKKILASASKGFP